VCDAEESEYKDWLLVVTDGNLSEKHSYADNQNLPVWQQSFHLSQ
jgi:hypothetical protein